MENALQPAGSDLWLPRDRRMRKLQKERLQTGAMILLGYLAVAVIFLAGLLAEVSGLPSGVGPLEGRILGYTALLFATLFSCPIYCLVMTATDRNLARNDPDFVYLQAAWAGMGFTLLSYLTPAMQALFLMTAVLALIFGVPRITPGKTLRLSIYVLALAWAIAIPMIADEGFGAVKDAQIAINLVGFTLAIVSALYYSVSMDKQRLARNRQALYWQQQVDRLRQSSATDELTGVSNRRSLMEALQRDKSLADRGSYGFVLCFADLDHFKRINDLHGHGVGDEVIKECAKVISKTVRAGDYVARMGGEEFVMVLVDARLETGQQVAERVRTQIMKLGEESMNPRMPRCEITVSVGLTQYQEGESLEETIQRADAALYDAKREGRNRVTLAPPPPITANPPPPPQTVKAQTTESQTTEAQTTEAQEQKPV